MFVCLFVCLFVCFSCLDYHTEQEEEPPKKKTHVRSVQGSEASEAESSPQQRTMDIDGLNSHMDELHQTKGQTLMA